MPTIKVTIDGSNALKASLKEVSKKYKATNDVTVGFGANYAAPVHENLEVFHPNGQAKYLEQPVRENRSTYISELIAVTKDEGINRALEHVGVLVLDDARAIVPVDTGFLRRSGFVHVRRR